jgi:hypothetical protein
MSVIKIIKSERLFVKSRFYIPIDIEKNEFIQKGDIFEVGYKNGKRIILMNIIHNIFISDNFHTLDGNGKRLGYEKFLSPLFELDGKEDSILFYFGENTDTIKNGMLYTMGMLVESSILLKEFPDILFHKTKFRLLTVEEERILKMKTIGFDFVS